MNKIINLSSRWTIFLFLLGGSLLGLSLFDHGNASASCGVQSGNIHDYAGLVVSSRYWDYDSSSYQPSNDNRVKVTTSGATTTPPGGVINLNNNQHYAEQTFSQIGGCPFLTGGVASDSTNAVLGTGGSSPDTGGGQTNWALDCDNSRRAASPELNPFQQFDVTGVGVPTGARGLRAGFGTAEGYGWNVRTVAPPNGDTTFVTITYNEPPPPDTGTPNGNMLFDCDKVYGYSTNKNKRYKMFVNSVSGNNEVTPGGRGATGPTEGLYSVPITGGTVGGGGYDGRTAGVVFILKIYAGNEDTTAEIQTLSSTTSTNQDCTEDLPAYSIASMTCRGITINISDPDDTGTGVYYEVYIYQDNDPGKLTIASGRGSGNVFLSYPAETAPNNGWVADLIVRDLRLNQTDGDTTTPVRASVGACYEASCSLDSITATSGAIPGASTAAGVAAGLGFNLNYTLSNTGGSDNNPLYAQIGSAPLALTTAGGTSPGFSAAAYYAVGQQVEVGSSVTGSFAFTAPPSAGRYTIEVYPDYYGLFGIGAPCSITIDVFQPFQVKPRVTSVTPNPNPEDPLSINYATRVEATLGTGPLGVAYFDKPILIAGNNQLNYLRHDPAPSTNTVLVGPPLDNDSINNNGKTAQPASTLNQTNTWQRVWNRTYFNAAAPTQFRAAPANTWNPGDQFCARMDINYNQGWTNGQPYPGAAKVLGTSTVIAPGLPNYDIMCGEVVNTPFMRAYGNDVISGGPTAGSGKVTGFMANPAQGAGSGGEFAVISATTPIDFASAFFRSATTPSATPKPQTPDELKLVNVLRPAGQPKYFDETIKRETKETPQGWPGSVAGVSSVQSNNQSYHASGGTLGGAAGFTGRHTMYVEGNVIINGDITYGPTGATIDSIPSFTLIVKGNIYISHNVKQLDGIYIAQSTTPAGANGEIHTCTNNGTPFNLASSGDRDILANLCSQEQLKINGLLAANKLKFYRVKYTLRDIKYNIVAGTRVYTPRESFDGVAQVPPNPTKAGEAVRMTPEVLLGQYGSSSSFRAQGSQTGNKYEYIVTLPPIL